MSETEYYFHKTIRYFSKDEDNLFIIKYQLHEEPKSSMPPPPSDYPRPSNEQKVEKPKKKIYMQQKQIQELKKYQNVNMKQVNRGRQGQEQRQQKKIECKREVYHPKQKTRKPYNEFADMPLLKKLRSKSSEIIEEEAKQIKMFQRNPTYGQSKRKRIYEEYISIAEIEESRANKERKYFKGRVQFFEGVKAFGRIMSTELEGNLIAEDKYCNRVIHQDEVYFLVLSENQQKVYCNIVACIKPKVVRQFVGRVEYLKKVQLYSLNPINRRIINMNIKLNNIELKWRRQLDKKYFLAEFVGWPADSWYPECRIIDEFGDFGSIDVEANALLKTHGVYDHEYTEEQIQEGLGKFIRQIEAKTGEYLIAEQEIASRTDLRRENIFTIDPLTARDFDDALSIRRIDANTQSYEIGVHIADASFFVQDDSVIDEEAKLSTTSVYLVHRVIPMLPRILCETMCSLNPGADRLTLSIWFPVDQDGNVGEVTRFDRSVINSRARFTYEQAQLIIEGKVTSQDQIEKGFGCIDAKDFTVIAEDICVMNRLALKLRKARIANGSLIFEVPKKSFTLNEQHFPTAFQVKERCESNFLVEEFMLLANQKVGEILVKHLKEDSILRRHKFPGDKKIEKFQNFMKKIGQPIKFEKGTRIQDEINKILISKTLKKCVKDVIKYEMISLLQAADYFLIKDSPRESWLHYALNMPIYTHFTSPIRRYPDILVHRQLIAILQSLKTKSKPKIDQNILNTLVERCNKNKMTAKRVSSGCEKIFLCLYLKDHPIITTAIITSIMDWGLHVCVPKYDFRSIIFLKRIPGLTIAKVATDAADRKFIKLEYKNKETSLKFTLRELQEIEIELKGSSSFPIDYDIKICMPHPEKEDQTLLIQ